ncbi:TonB-dependent receptor [Rheinheimera sp. NSM]|uniref:TonB-dependent receptor n=1 Tax=Rheinheimera sp. NSM TaxID=3457884 RepID=UPI004036A65B
MFKPSVLSSAVAMAITLSAQPLYAQQSSDDSTVTPDDVEVILVKGIRGSLARSVDLKRENMQIVDSIISEDIGKFPDNNVVEALQRLSGVQVTDRGAGEVSTVSIRGLNDVTTTVNGRNIFTASGRSVALADIPASLLNRVDVYKTRSASLIETGIAGQIDIHTQRPFDFDSSKMVLAGRGIYSDQTDKTDPNISALFSNNWDIGDSRFGALINLSYAETHYRDQSVTAGAMMPFATNNPPAGWAPYEIIRSTDGRAAENPIWQPGLEAGLPFAPGSTFDVNGVPTEYLLSRDAVFASDLTGKRERPAVNVAFQFAPNDSSEYIFEAFYNGFRNESYNSLLFSFVDWWGNLGDNPDISLFEGTNIIKSRTVGSPYMFTSGDLSTGKTDSYVYALGGKWLIGDNLQLRSEVVYQDSQYDESFFAMRTERVADSISVDFNSGGGLPAFQFGPATDLTAPDQWAMAQLYDQAYSREGDAITFTLDADYMLHNSIITNISFGGRYDKRKASEAQLLQDTGLCNSGTAACQLASYEGLLNVNRGFFDGESDVPDSWLSANGYYIRDNADMFRTIYNTETGSSLAVGEQRILAQTFEVTESTTALYAQANFETELGGRLFDGQFGLRYVDVDTDMAFAGNTASTGTSKVLPSLMLRYNLTDDLLARFSYGETLRRPAFAQLNPTINYVRDVTNIGYGTASGGNPELEPTESKNFDLSLEWYFAEGSTLYATAFKRDIEGFVVDFRRRVIHDDGQGEYPYILNQPDNASNGKLDGYELGVVYFPKGLPDLLDGIGVQASYTMLDSTQDIPITDSEGNVVGTDTTPLFGVSDSSYSVVLAYEKQRFDMRLSYVWREDFLNNYEAAQFANPLGIYRNPEKSLDFQLSYHVTDNLMLTFDATNLTNEIFQSYYEYPSTHNFGSSLFSRTFALGFRYSL